jgi:hypothetical protein
MIASKPSLPEVVPAEWLTAELEARMPGDPETLGLLAPEAPDRLRAR